MQIRFIYFAGCREAVGRTSDDVDLPEGSSLEGAIAWLRENRPSITPLLQSARIAVNAEFAYPEQLLKNGDELVVIPPVSGGLGTRAVLTQESLERESATRLLSVTGAGAVITFAGVVRPTSKYREGAVSDLYYEAYSAMAIRTLEQCLREAGERWVILDAAVIHRLGALTLGEVAVSIAVASAHRAEAFAACAYIIDRIKEIVPIWKKETGPDGSAWVSEGA
jgi:molybdopterin synthase catalytic subunit